VTYFNAVSGTGRLLDREGNPHFIHFSKIQDGGRFPMVTPAKVVMFKRGKKRKFSDEMAEVLAVQIPKQ
jgi:cold shock CspA family protein